MLKLARKPIITFFLLGYLGVHAAKATVATAKVGGKVTAKTAKVVYKVAKFI